MDAEKKNDLDALIAQRESEQIEQAVDADVEVAASPEEVRSTVVRDYLRQELGYDLDDDTTDEDLAPQLAGLIRQTAEDRQKWSQFEKERAELEELRKLRDQLQAGKQEAEQPKQSKPEEKAKPKSALEYDPEWETAAEYDPQTRSWVPKDKYGTWGETAARKLNEFEKVKHERAALIVSNPLEYMKLAGIDDILAEYESKYEKLADERAKSYVEKLRDEILSQRQQDQIESFFQQNKATFFELDAKGNPKVDPLTGAPVRTGVGELYVEAAQEARDLGVNDEARIHAYALKRSQREMTPSEQAKSEKTTKTTEKKDRETFLRKAAAKQPLGDREGHRIAAAKGDFLAESELSFKEMLLRDHPEFAEKSR